MSLKSKGKIVACLDMGTSKLVCIIASINNDEISILGYGYRKSRGIVASAISDMKLAQKSIANVVSDAEKMAGFNIDRLIVGLSGCETLSQKKIVKSKIASDVVKSSDISNLANSIRFHYKNNNQEIIHLMPLQYRIDNSHPIQNPRYMSGKELSAKFHIISTSFTTTKNIELCLNRCQLSVYNYISEAYSSALSCLTKNELNLGTLIIDIGGGGTSFAVISDKKLIHTDHFPVGGTHITRDISMILNLDVNIAETIKNLNSSLSIHHAEERELINVRAEDFHILHSHKITKKTLREIIQSRLEEIFESVKNKLDKSGYGSMIINNIVLTGGVTNIAEINKIAYNIFKKPVRIGFPQKIDNLPEKFEDPSFCSVFGMLVFLQEIYSKERIQDGFESKNGLLKKIIDKLMSI